MMQSGIISKNFDQRITEYDKLYNLDENSHIQLIFLTSKVALQDKPKFISKLPLTEDHSLESLNYFSDTLKIRVSVTYDCPVDKDEVFEVMMLLKFEGCPQWFSMMWRKTCKKEISKSGIISGVSEGAQPMVNLVIQENNKLFSRPIVFKEGEIKEKDIVVPGNMDQMYLKIESVNNSIVRLASPKITLVLLETSLYK